MRDRLETLLHRPAAREPVVDGVRAIAVLWVFAFHVLFFQLGRFPDEVADIGRHASTRWILQGALGVDLFFVISGYLIGSILLRELAASGTIALKRFYARRLIRLMPVYAVVMLLAAWFLRDIPSATFGMEISPSGNVENAWANLLHVNNFLPIHEQYMGWCWSLAIEEQFYLVAPLFLLVVVGRSRKPLTWMLVLMALSGFIRLGVIIANDLGPPVAGELGTLEGARRFDLVYDKPHVRYGGLLVGVIAAYASVIHVEATRRWLARPMRSVVIALFSLLVIGFIASLSVFSIDPNSAPRLVGQLVYSHHRDAFSVAAMSIILVAIHGQGALAGALRRLLSVRALYPIAQLSYSIYLVHAVVMIWVFPRIAPFLTETWGLGEISTIATNGAVAAVVTVVLACLLFLLVELPSMELRKTQAFERCVSRTGHRTRRVAPK